MTSQPENEHQGQCPACYQVLDLSDQPLATVMQCQCGASLFVSGARAMRKVPVRCNECEKTYKVLPEQIGKVVRCKCGGKIKVLDRVLRQPLEADDVVTQVVEDLPQHEPLPEAPTSTESEDETKNAAKNKAKAGPEAVARIASDQTVASDQTMIVAKPRTTGRRRPTASSDEEQARPAREIPWLPIIGLGSVAAFFLFSIYTFISRRPTGNQTVSRPNGPAAQPAVPDVPQPIPQGRIQELLRQVPAPGPSASPATAATAKKLGSPSNTSEVGTANVEATSVSPFGPRTAGRKVQLPERVEPRERIPFVPVRRSSLVLASAYQDAFTSYEELNQFENDKKSTSNEEYRTALGETLFQTKHAFQIAVESKDEQKRNELCYLLAYLSFTAGHLEEAAIYGEAAARWGDLDETSTHEAAMIALAACQEANASQWGVAEQVGELTCMRTLAELIDERWPDDEQSEAVWMHLAQSYSAFNQPLLAADAYKQIKKDSEQYESAQLAAGGAYWSHFLDAASVDEPDPDEMVSILKSAQTHLAAAVNSMQEDKPKPSLGLLSAKLTLAKISDRLGNHEDVIRWITDPPLPVTTTMSTSSKVRKNEVRVDSNFTRSVFDMLYQANVHLENWSGASDALTRLSKLPESAAPVNLGPRYLNLARALIASIQQSKSFNKSQSDELQSLFASVASHDRAASDSAQLWMGESWAELATIAGNGKLSQACYANAAAAYEKAMKQRKFPKASIQSATLRRAELLRLAGNKVESLDALSSVLKQAPNAIAVQMQAAYALQEIGFKDDTVTGIRSAVLGPRDGMGNAEDSPIWGWARLTTTLHRLRYSQNGTEQHKELLNEAQFHLLRCQWLLASVTDNKSEQQKQLGKINTQLARLMATSSEQDAPKDKWQKGLEKILALTKK